MKPAFLIAAVLISLSPSAKCEEVTFGRGPASLMDIAILASDTDLKREAVAVTPEEFQGPTNLLPDVDIELMEMAEHAPQD